LKAENRNATQLRLRVADLCSVVGQIPEPDPGGVDGLDGPKVVTRAPH
jgi:hypothetical protein